MPTLKQAEAVYWVHTLGGFAAAAQRLNTTQSTISKRVLELEKHYGVELFDRDAGAGHLSLKGREVIDTFATLLRLRDEAALVLGGTAAYGGRFRLGVTEMVALTWLPALLSALRQTYPRIDLEPRIDVAGTMLPHLAQHRLDAVICPQPDDVDGLTYTPLHGLDFVWMASPTLAADLSDPAALLDRLPLLAYADGSLLHLRMRRDLALLGVRGGRTITCNSMIALAEMAKAGLGATYIPRDYFADALRDGSLVEIPTGRDAQPLPYAAFHLGDPVGRHIAELAGRCCDFRASKNRMNNHHGA